MAKKKEENAEEITENVEAAKTEEKAEKKTKKTAKSKKADEKAEKQDEATADDSIIENVIEAAAGIVGDIAEAVAETASDIVDTASDAVETAADTVKSVVGISDEKEKSLVKHSKRAEKVGIVQSDKMTNTVTVRVDRVVKHPLYRKYVKRKKKFMAHDELGATIGDKVRIVETRPLSARKRWRVVEIVQKTVK
jgi:small subunit ribosomal protein S17